MIKFRFLGKLFFFLVILQMISPVMATGQNCSYEVFSDEFDYEGEPNPDHWNYETGAGGWGNNELQNYTDSRDNSYVSNGTLKIHARKSETGAWTSARMVTAGNATWKYGRFEIRAKLPHGVGTWPAIWMMPAESVYGIWPKSGEIDIMEHVGYDPGIVHGSIHTEAYNHKDGTQKGGSIEVPDAQTNFHVYSIEWTPDQITWFVDGEQYFSFSNQEISYKEWPFDQSFFLILNIAIGGDWGGVEGVDPDLEEAVMEVDYVRVYKNSLPDFSVKGPDLVQEGEEVSFSVPAIDGIEYQWTIPDDAQIISGNNTHEITLNWGASSGTVGCRLISECEEKEGQALQVKLLKKPSSAPLVLTPVKEQNQVLWEVPEQDAGNQFTLSAHNDALRVDYAISEPQSNPYITLPLSFIADLSDFRSVELPIKILSGDTPNILRMDLVDQNGRVNISDLFKIEDPIRNQHFHIYHHTFSGSNSIWNMTKIKEVRLYVDYGSYGKTGEGTFEIGDIRLAPEEYFPTPQSPGEEGFQVTTQTGDGGWQVNEPVSGIFDLNGGSQLQVSYSSVEASDENFIQVDFESPVDLHKFAQLNVEFAPDMDWPDQMEAAIIDRNGVFNANDLFVLNDFPVSEDNKTLSYVFTDVEDGGNFLPSRVKSLRFWFERTSGTNRTVDFIIENIWFSEADPGNAIFEKNRFSDIRVWPNPARNFLYFENMGSPVKAWEIYSIPGRKVAEGNLSGQKNMISVANLPDGLYVLIMKAGDGTYYRTKFRVRK